MTAADPNADPAPAPFVIPTIDMAPYLADPSSAAAAQVVADVRQACMTTGFFSLVGHGIPRALQERVFAACAAFFALPLAEKKALVPRALKNRGYELIGSQALQAGALPDLKEGFYVGQHVPDDDERARRHPELIGANIFPASLPAAAMQEPMEEYYDAVFSVGSTVMEILAKGLPYGDGIFDEFLSNDPVCSVRMLHYPPQKSEDVRQLGAGAHTDFGAITLLMQDDSGGLEVLNDATGEWIPVDPNPDAYVVNIGDMLALWTRHIYKSNTHRVINKGLRDRYSVPFFLDGNADVELRPFDCSGGDARAKTVEEHMLERFGTTYGRAKAGATAAH